MASLTSYAIEAELSGVGAGWTNITADVLIGQNPLVFRYGIGGSTPLDRVADVGYMTFTLDNSAGNSAGLLGYYSPMNTNCRSGFTWGIAVRVKLVFGGVTYYKWRGKISEIDPQPGRYLDRVTYVRCVDWMDEAAEFEVRDVTPQLGKRSDEVFSAVLAAMPKQPAATSIQSGLDTYVYSLDDLGDHPRAATVFQKIAQSELGWIYVKGDTTQGGTLVFENRARRPLAGPINVFSLNDNFTGMVAPRTLAMLLNRVEAIVHPKTIDAAATTVLCQQLSGNAVTVAPGETVTLWLDYRDPTQSLSLIGGTASIPPVATTDYTMNTFADGTGTNVTTNFTVTATAFAASAKFDITNNFTQSAYITKLQLRGKGIYDYGPKLFRSENTASQAAQGLRAIQVDMPYQNDPANGQGAAELLLNLYKDPITHVSSVRFFASRTNAMLTAALAQEIGDRIGIDETVTGVTQTIPASSAQRGFYINSVMFSIVPSKDGPLVNCEWGLSPADALAYWILGDAASQLGVNTILGYL